MFFWNLLPVNPTTALKGQGPYAKKLKTVEGDIKDIQKRINEKLGSCPPYLFNT